MGYTVNEFVVAYLPEFSDGRADASAALASLKNHSTFGCCVGGPVLQAVNDYGETWTLGPDGSKEGWPESDAGDEFRKCFVDMAKLCERADILHFKMGGDDAITRILYQTDEETS